VFVIINIVIFILNLLSLTNYGLEQIIALVGTILFLIASVLLIWLAIEKNNDHVRFIIPVVLVVVQFVLHLYDLKILRGEASN
jgi:TRAP-type mannitol/chloroaromatic compound transport system permease small subunit